MKDLEKMKEVHDQIKNHPFRISERGIDSYYKLIKELVDLFYEALLVDFAPANTKIPSSFFHEMMSNALAMRDNLDGMSFENKSNTIASIDSNIGIIHRYIDTGKFESFRTYYRGCNFGKHGRWTDYVFDKKLNRFRWHEKYKDEVIEDYEKTVKDYNGADKEKRVKEWEELLEYWKTL